MRYAPFLSTAEHVGGLTGTGLTDAALSAHVDDVTDSGRGETAERLRPFYIDDLRRHGVRAP